MGPPAHRVFSRVCISMVCWLMLLVYAVSLLAVVRVEEATLTEYGLYSGAVRYTPGGVFGSTGAFGRGGAWSGNMSRGLRPNRYVTQRSYRLPTAAVWALGGGSLLVFEAAPAGVAWLPRNRADGVIIPLWPPAAVAGAVLLLGAFRRVPRGRCAECFYDLHGLPLQEGAARCPECGVVNRDRRRIVPTAAGASFALRWGGAAVVAALLFIYPISFWRQCVFGYERTISVWWADGVIGANLQGSEFTLFMTFKDHAWLKPKYPFWHWRARDGGAQCPIWAVMVVVGTPTVWAWRRQVRGRREDMQTKRQQETCARGSPRSEES